MKMLVFSFLVAMKLYIISPASQKTHLLLNKALEKE